MNPHPKPPKPPKPPNPPPSRPGWALRASLGLALAGWAVHMWGMAQLAQQAARPVPPWLTAVLLLYLAAAALAALQLWQRFRQARRQSRALAEMAQRLAEQQAAAHEASRQTHAALAAAEAADQAKARFLAAASHDLRQPAHALGLYTAALCAGPLAPEQAELAERMQAALRALEAMFAGLLEVSRIDADAVLPQWDTLALAPLLHRLAHEWAPEAESRGLRLAVHVADPEALTVSDPLLLERVLRNLLANAVKYTRRGGVLLACRTRTAADGVRSLRIELWDTGVGIAPAEQARVFEEFYQAGNPRRDGSHGLGLGLAIVWRLARLLQLRVSLHSVPGRGSVFFLDGLVPAGSAPLRAAAARLQMRRLSGLCVAVLEDDAAVRDAMGRLLRLWGCEVLDAADAPALLQRQPPGQMVHAVVADVHLVGARLGPDEVQALLAAWGRSVPVLLVSGDTAPAQIGALQAQGHTVLAKPVSPARLRAWLEQATAEPAHAQAR